MGSNDSCTNYESSIYMKSRKKNGNNSMDPQPIVVKIQKLEISIEQKQRILISDI